MLAAAGTLNREAFGEPVSVDGRQRGGVVSARSNSMQIVMSSGGERRPLAAFLSPAIQSAEPTLTTLTTSRFALSCSWPTTTPPLCSRATLTGSPKASRFERPGSGEHRVAQRLQHQPAEFEAL